MDANGIPDPVLVPVSHCSHATKDDCAAAECFDGGIRDCVYSEPLHYHHDGCPAAYTADDVDACDKEELLALYKQTKARLAALLVAVDKHCTAFENSHKHMALIVKDLREAGIAAAAPYSEE